MTDRDLAHLAAFFAKAQGPLFAEIAEIAQAQPGDGADLRAGVGKHPEHGTIAQADDVTEVDRAQQFARLLDADLRRGAVGDAMLDAAHGSNGIEREPRGASPGHRRSGAGPRAPGFWSARNPRADPHTHRRGPE